MKRLVLVAVFAASFASASIASFYQYDDGVSESNLSTSGSGLNVVYLTQFVAASGGLNLTSIDVVWGSRVDPTLPNGLATQVLLMSDPNQDGNPNDSTVLQAIAATTVNVGTDTFNNYAITPTALTTGQSFFLGVFIPNCPSGPSWCGIDTNATGMSTKNWWTPVGTPGSASYIGLDVFGSQDWTFMVRGNVTTVPEPASMAVLGLGAFTFLRRRSRKH